VNSSLNNQNLLTLEAAGQTFGELTSVEAALHRGVAGNLESSVTDTTAALERMLEEIRQTGQPVGDDLAVSAVALGAKAMQLHVMLEYLAGFEKGWAALIHSRQGGYTEQGGAAVRTDPTAVWMEA
jgi:hypothetical protein